MNKTLSTLLTLSTLSWGATASPVAPDISTFLAARYYRDISNETGRVAWHGRLVAEAIDTNALVKVETYADGWVWREPMKPKAVIRSKSADPNLPERLRAAREKRQRELATTNTVTVEITGNATR